VSLPTPQKKTSKKKSPKQKQKQKQTPNKQKVDFPEKEYSQDANICSDFLCLLGTFYFSLCPFTEFQFLKMN
jgi:hypothetical protein